VSLCRAFQKRETESLSWSDIISEERPFSQYHSLRNVIASFSVVNEQVVGISRMSDPSRSVMVKTQEPFVTVLWQSSATNGSPKMS